MPNRSTHYHYRTRYGEILASRRWGRHDWQPIEQTLAETLQAGPTGQSTAAFVRGHNRQARLLRGVALRPCTRV